MAGWFDRLYLGCYGSYPTLTARIYEHACTSTHGVSCVAAVRGLSNRGRLFIFLTIFEARDSAVLLRSVSRWSRSVERVSCDWWYELGVDYCRIRQVGLTACISGVTDLIQLEPRASTSVHAHLLMLSVA